MKILLKETSNNMYLGYIIVEHETRIYADIQEDFLTLAKNLIDRYYELQFMQGNKIQYTFES